MYFIYGDQHIGHLLAAHAHISIHLFGFRTHFSIIGLVPFP